jgi:hypothetical protein
VTDEFAVWRPALAADDPVEALRSLVRRRLAAGVPREQVTGELTRLVLDLRRARQPEAAEEPVLDVLDMLTGWSAPGSAL